MQKYFGLFITAAILLMAVSPSLAEEPQCAGCGRRIPGEYLEFNGKAYCSQDCLDRALPKCAVCGKPVTGGQKRGEYLTHKGRHYCSQKCFDATLSGCATCGKTVNGGLRSGDKLYCNERCYQSSLPVCAACGKRCQSWLQAEGDTAKYYCSEPCYSTTLPECSLCNARMKSWVEVDSVKFCTPCSNLPRCAGCQHPGADVKLGDGRLLCRPCHRIAVMDEDEARRLFQRVRSDMKDSLGLGTDHDISFHLVDLKTLSRKLGKKEAGEKGFYQYRGSYLEQGGRTSVVSESFDIFVLDGLSPEQFMDVAAHELAHDINQQFFPKAGRLEDKEGFAEYVASLMNVHWGRPQLNEGKRNNTYKFYADCYKKFLKLGGDGGLAAVQRYMRESNR